MHGNGPLWLTVSRGQATMSSRPHVRCRQEPPMRAQCNAPIHLRELSLFPSRSPPQVGPGVRIHFPPAASPQTLGPSI
jgi:hypothetical protein